jgi:hypothetical protein
MPPKVKHLSNRVKMPPKVKHLSEDKDMSESTETQYDNLTNSAKKKYHEIITFLSSDRAKTFGKNALITIISMMIIGGISMNATESIDRIQHGIDKGLYDKLDDVRERVEAALPPDITLGKVNKDLQGLIVTMLSHVGGGRGNMRAPYFNFTGRGLKNIKHQVEDPKKGIVKTITDKIQAFIKKNKLAVASSATAATALAITIGYVIAITGGRSDEINRFITNNGHALIVYFTEMGSTSRANISKFVQTALDAMGNLYYDISFIRGRGLSGGEVKEKSSKSTTEQIKDTMKSIGKKIYDVAVSETGQAIGQGLLFTLILAGVAYGLGPRAAQLARPMIEHMQNRLGHNTGLDHNAVHDVNSDFMTNAEVQYWKNVQTILINTEESNDYVRKEALSHLKSDTPNANLYHMRHPELYEELLNNAPNSIIRARGLNSKGSGIIKDTANLAHKYIMSEEGRTLGKTALTALILAAISKGVTDVASSEIYDYADKPAREREMYNKYRESRSNRSAARWANEHRNNGHFDNPEIRL